MPTVIGLDPGAVNGIAVFQDGKLTSLVNVNRLGLLRYLSYASQTYPNLQVIMEDSRMAPFWADNKSQKVRAALPVMVRAARNLGQVDCLCNLVHEWCIDSGVPIICVSPKQKGAKVTSHGEFAKMSGWGGKSSSQHERDAWLVAHRYRHIRVVGKPQPKTN